MPFALVRWLTGKEKDTYTIVDSRWILEVDWKLFDNSQGLFLSY